MKAVPSSPPGLSFHALGQLEGYYDDVELDLGPRKQRAVLAVLLLNANHVVSTERLIDDLWGESPPSTARAALQVHVAGLRKALRNGGASLRTRAPGYVLELDAGALDLDRFTQLRAEARESSDAERRAALLHEALALWRDAPLPELRAEPFATAAVAQLEQLRLAVLEERIDADLALGRHAALVTELEALVAEHPLSRGASRPADARPLSLGPTGGRAGRVPGRSPRSPGRARPRARQGAAGPRGRDPASGRGAVARSSRSRG